MKNITSVIITQYNSNRQIENQVDVTSIAKPSSYKVFCVE